MPQPPPWNPDQPAFLPRIAANAARLARSIHQEAASRAQPEWSMAKTWHRTFFAGVPAPRPYYIGEIRDSDPRFPDLVNHEVMVVPENLPGVPAFEVPARLITFQEGLHARIAPLDEAIASGGPPATQADNDAVLAVCAWTHGEWIRIHPFVNGNGRTARAWVLWLALRYGLPPFIRLHPRPGGDAYKRAASVQMDPGYDRPMQRVFTAMLSSIGGAQSPY